MMYYINALEYLGRKLKSGAEAKRFVTLKKSETMPTREEVEGLAKENPKVRKVWVMELDGNKWRKTMDVVDI